MVNIDEFKDNILHKVRSEFKIESYYLGIKSKFNYPSHVPILKFNVEQYKVNNLGNIAILKGKGVAFMELITIVFTPSIEMDIPFLIIDFVKIMNKRTVFVEFFENHVIQRNNIKELEGKLKSISFKYNTIENYIEKPNWYVPLRNKYSPLKKGKKENDSVLYEMVFEYLDIYLNYVKQITPNIKSKKNIELEKFLNDLIIKKNPSSFIIERALGKDEAKKFFEEIIFYYDK